MTDIVVNIDKSESALKNHNQNNVALTLRNIIIIHFGLQHHDFVLFTVRLYLSRVNFGTKTRSRTKAPEIPVCEIQELNLPLHFASRQSLGYKKALTMI